MTASTSSSEYNDMDLPSLPVSFSFACPSSPFAVAVFDDNPDFIVNEFDENVVRRRQYAMSLIYLPTPPFVGNDKELSFTHHRHPLRPKFPFEKNASHSVIAGDLHSNRRVKFAGKNSLKQVE